MPTSKEKKIIFGVSGALLLIAVFVILLLMRSCSPEETDTPFGQLADGTLEMDANAQKGGLTYRSQEEIQAELNRKVEEGMINISMNTSPLIST